MSAIVIKKFDLDKDNGLVSEIASCYIEIFADAPWHEWKKCPKCKKYWGKKDKETLEVDGFIHCGVSLEDFYSPEWVREKLLEALQSGGRCLLAMDGERVVGFYWGRVLSPEELDKKAKFVVSQSLFETVGEVDRIAYQEELALLNAYRGRGIASALVKKDIEASIEEGFEVFAASARRSPEPSLTYTWFTAKFGYQVIAAYPEDSGRVVLARRSAGLHELVS